MKEKYIWLNFNAVRVICSLWFIFDVGTIWGLRKYALQRQPYQAGKAIMQQLLYGAAVEDAPGDHSLKDD